ncbi:tRNA (guanosine(46)-N7)-methyltransferase TrmB [Hippea sp. KM1]|uniref:tRNA (guanosine(46)-N7)-methyltransferase TrmB n=1 Tax=Hippea sp. KM1 TaxID=944481 RepID=UPI00046D4C6A|nr:tRNA (guanosine(46)-N7)-methyltransferase TrmB [Hippea sp. KM1]
MPHAIIETQKNIETFQDDKAFFSAKGNSFIYSLFSDCEQFFVKVYQKQGKVIVKLEKSTNPIITDDVKAKILEFAERLAGFLNGQIIHNNLTPNGKNCQIVNRYAIDARRLNTIDLSSLAKNRPIKLEIGSGFGEFLSNQAEKEPNTLFLGLEISNEATAKACGRLYKKEITNVRLIRYDGRFVLDRFSSNTVDAVFVNFPEPWFKFRRIKHALLNTDTLRKIEKILKKGGEFRLLTDNLAYALGVVVAIEEKTNLRNAQNRPIEVSKESINTKFERRWRRKKRTIYSVGYKKTEQSPTIQPPKPSFSISINREFILKDGIIFKVMDTFENKNGEKIIEATFGKSINPQHAFFGLTQNSKLFMLPQTVFVLDEEAEKAFKLIQ